MTVRRGPLYLGAFLLAAGGVTLLAATGVVDPVAIAGTVVVLWPLAVIAIGVGLVLRRSPAALPAGLVAALLPGLALGASITAAPTSMPVPCTDRGGPLSQAPTRTGPLGTEAVVDLTLACGELRVTTAPGNDWRLDTSDGTNRTTRMTSDTGRLEVSSNDRLRGWRLDTGPVEWDVVLPTGTTIDLATTVDAGAANLDLANARLGQAQLAVNAGSLEADLTGASIESLDVEVNAGSASVTLPTATFGGRLEANAGSIELCTPADLGLRVHAVASLGSTDLNGLVQRNGAWETPGYATAPVKADLDLQANLGSIAINPQGGCK